ncbi:MAG: radical SAM protein [Thermoplasmatales archaeon]|nr:MAG: radical SAM protein [Thermoplasmatales archaeon]
MKILLIEPNIKGYTFAPTLSLSLLKGFINEKTRHEAKIIELVFHKKDWKKLVFEKIREEKPDIIGISVLSFNHSEALKIARFIKYSFNIKIIFGGVHVILSPQEVIENEEVDIICTGEGEEVLKELLDNNLNCKDIKGIWYKRDGEIIKNGKRRLIENLDTLPFPDFEDFDLEKYFVINNSHLPIMASRGCPYVCSYCSNHALSQKLDGKYVRFRSVNNVIEEIELRINQLKGLKYLYFHDDIFILYEDFVIDFCKKFKDKGFHRILKWNANVRVNLVTDKIIKTMKNAGCYEARMGVESGNDYIRNKVYKRNMTKEQIFNAFQIIKDNGLHLRLYFLVGAPYETVEMLDESFDVAKKSNADLISFTYLLPLPGTEIKEVFEKENLLEYTNSGNFNHVVNPAEKTKFVSGKQMRRFLLKVKIWQIQKYFREGIGMNGLFFLRDILLSLPYYKVKYDLGLKQIYRWTVQRYKLGKL